LSTAGFGPWFAYQDDDLGEGSTLVELPALASAAPQPNESLPAGGWTAYAALAGPANPLHPGLPVHAPAEVVASTAALDLAIAPAGGGPPALNRQAALGSDAQGAFGSVSIGALPVGRYTAAWTLTDSHGDTQQVAPLFFVQPGPAQAGASGRGGERRVFYKLKCVPKTFHRGGRTFTRESCTVRVRAPWARRVTAVISRHHRVFARGQAAPRAGVAHVSLKDLRRLVPGNYRLTITVAAGRFRRVFRRTVHVQRVRGTIVARL
jgi:hypothetical protein